MANGMVLRYPLAMITFDTSSSVGETLSACLKKLMYDLVIGQIDGVTDGNDVKISVALTLQQSKEKDIKKPLK